MVQDKSLFWIRAISGLGAILGLLILLISEVKAAPEEVKKGFQPGVRTIQVQKPGTPIPQNNIPDAKITPSGIQLGGENPGGVIAGSNLSPLKVDIDSGEGSKDIITDFNYPDADILDIAKTIGKLTGKNFIYDQNVKGRVSIISNSPISVGDAWRAFLTALDINGFTLVPSGEYIRIARQREARDKQLNTYTDNSPPTDALITRIFPLKYISAEDVVKNFRTLLPPNARILSYDQTNTVILTETGSNVTKFAKILEFLDVEGFDAGIEVVPVRYASAAELAKLIDTLLPGNAGGALSRRANTIGGRASNFSARRTKEGGVINTIIADERTNTLIVHANAKGTEQVRELVAKLDQRLPSTAGGGKVHVMYLQFADAKKVAETLNNLSSTRGATAPQRAGIGINPQQTELFEGNIKVAADEGTNSLVITASPADFVVLQRVIGKLDSPRDEVYVEVVIMEVSLGKNFTFSSNVVLPSKGIALTPGTDLIDFLANPLSQKGFVFNFQKGGEKKFNIGGKEVGIRDITGLIRALQTNSTANILATPQLLTLDNTEAEFETAEKIPVPTTTATQTAVSTSITKEPIGIKMKIKPHLNQTSNFVKLDIEALFEDISGRELPAQVAGIALATFSRRAKTTVVVGDSDTVVLGGLIRDKQTETVSKVPILGDIPILGWLFKARNESSEKTNLLIFITPHIIHHYDKVRAILDRKLKQRDDFIEAERGGDDPQRKARDEMIRSLPEIVPLKTEKEARAAENPPQPDQDTDEAPPLDEGDQNE